MPRRRLRTLKADEVELWRKVIENAAPLHPERPAQPIEKALSKPKTAARPIPGFHIGEAAGRSVRAPDLAPGLSEHIARQPVSMDAKRYQRMKKGRLAPEDRLDLHGLTLAQAQPVLTGFILDAVARRLRLVLVITGKGRPGSEHGPIPERRGALRHQVPHWLHSPPLKAHVLQIAEAHLKHGGQGALYVYLRRAGQ